MPEREWRRGAEETPAGFSTGGSVGQLISWGDNNITNTVTSGSQNTEYTVQRRELAPTWPDASGTAQVAAHGGEASFASGRMTDAKRAYCWCFCIARLAWIMNPWSLTPAARGGGGMPSAELERCLI